MKFIAIIAILLVACLSMTTTAVHCSNATFTLSSSLRSTFTPIYELINSREVSAEKALVAKYR